MSGGECMRLLCPDALNGRPHWHTRPADDTTAGERCRVCGGVNGKHDGATHDARVADMPLPATPDADDTPPPAEKCPDCRHAPHDSIGFCPNMASDNDCDCKRGTPPPAAGDVEALCLRPSGDDWECRAPAGHADGMHVWGLTDRALLFHNGWSEQTPMLRLPVTVDRETALRLLRDPEALKAHDATRDAVVAERIAQEFERVGSGWAARVAREQARP